MNWTIVWTLTLLFLYAHSGELRGAANNLRSISNKEYCIRLAEAVVRTITQPTP